MSVIDSTEFPTLAAPRRPEGRTSMRRSLRDMRDNALAAHPPENFAADIIAQRILWRRMFIINEPGAIKYILLDNAANYTKSEVGRRLLEPGLGRGLLTSEGETWRRHRRIMAPSFDPRSVIGYAPIMTSVTEDLLAKWDALPEPRELDVAAEMMHITLHIISRAMFSSDSDEIVDVVEGGVSQYQTLVRPSVFDLLHVPQWFARLMSPLPTEGIFDEFDAKVDRLLTERGRAPDAEPKDLLARLIAARDGETGGGMTGKEVRDQVVTIFMAGHETTSLALSWTWYLLSQHPAVEAKLYNELRDVLDGRTPEYADVANLRYTRMVIEESMRLYPPAHTTGRQPIAADEILGHRIPAGAEVLIMPWLLHRKPSAVGKSGPLRSGALSARARRRTPALCLHAVRRRTAHLHRRGIRHDRGGPDSRHHRATLPAASEARPSGRAARPDHAAAAPRAADDVGAAVSSARRIARLSC